MPRRANSDAIRYGMVRMGKLRGRARASECDQSSSDGAEHRQASAGSCRSGYSDHILCTYTTVGVPRGDAGIELDRRPASAEVCLYTYFVLCSPSHWRPFTLDTLGNGIVQVTSCRINEYEPKMADAE